MRYEVKGGSFPVVVCNLDSGEQMITEKGSMVWMSPNIEMQTSAWVRCFPRHFPARACSRILTRLRVKA